MGPPLSTRGLKGAITGPSAGLPDHARSADDGDQRPPRGPVFDPPSAALAGELLPTGPDQRPLRPASLLRSGHARHRL